jgi:hypothetical protein
MTADATKIMAGNPINKNQFKSFPGAEASDFGRTSP